MTTGPGGRVAIRREGAVLGVVANGAHPRSPSLLIGVQHFSESVAPSFPRSSSSSNSLAFTEPCGIVDVLCVSVAIFSSCGSGAK